MSGPPTHSRALRVLVDPAVCLGGGQCEHFCPEVFEVDDVARVRTKRVDPRHAHAVETAALACPSGAIRVVADPDA